MNRELLLREVKYRASYRGTLELDTVCRSLLPHINDMADEELAALANLLQQPENRLMEWLVEGAKAPQEHQLIVQLVRYHFKNRPR
ncbi:MAG: succinate dehydrogenase assembly factor 2 [Proteobacteria bacterium]|nr:succinate dehydrogenase assembly factor 2 [Pseudomonadota bacterium]